MLRRPKNVRTAHWDCTSGISGDSLFVSCINAASDDDSKAIEMVNTIESYIKDGLVGLNGQFRLQLDFVCRNDVESAMRINVREQTGEEMNRVLSTKDTKEMLSNSQSQFIPLWVRDTSIKVLREIDKASERISKSSNGMTLGLDSIIYVIGTLLCLHSLGIQTVSCSPLPLGDDMTSPAKDKHAASFQICLELLKGMMTCPAPPGTKGDMLLTPTAVALLRVLTEVSRMEKHKRSPMSLRASGIGFMGQAAQDDALVRIHVGDIEVSTNLENVESEAVNHPTLMAAKTSHETSPLESELWLSDNVTQMEMNLDDITGERLAYVIDLLLQNGAIDAWVTPIVMKKGRPSHTLHCLCRCGRDEDDRIKNDLLEILFRHTTTLGIRIYSNIPRAKLIRSFDTVQTPYVSTSRKGRVNVKVGKFKNDDVISVKAEFDDCKLISNETGVPLNMISDYSIRKVLDDRIG